MADNVIIPVTGTGDATPTIAADDVGGAKYQRVKISWGVDGAVVDASATNPFPVTLLAGVASIGILGANSGIDIGDVTINNTSGASAVNIQDGGNSITVDNGGTFATQESQILADNAGFTDGTTKVFATGFIFDEVAGTTLTENDVGAGRMDIKRAMVNVIEDATVRGRRAIVNYQGRQVFEKSTDGVTISGNVLLESLRQPVNVNANGQILISGVANRKIRVLNGLLMAPTAVTISLKSNNSSDCTGPLAMGATGGFQIPMADIGDFETLVGQNLTISMSSAVQVGGWLTYVLV